MKLDINNLPFELQSYIQKVSNYNQSSFSNHWHAHLITEVKPFQLYLNNGFLSTTDPSKNVLDKDREEWVIYQIKLKKTHRSHDEIRG